MATSFEKTFTSTIEMLVLVQIITIKLVRYQALMDGTVNEGILLHKGQEKRKTL